MPGPIQRVRDFFVELKRRKVYHVAVIYVVAAAGALQLVDAIVPSTRLPGWSDEFFLGLVVLGFPLALVLAWAFEMTPEGVRRTPVGPSGEADGKREAPAPVVSAHPPAPDPRTVTDDSGSHRREAGVVGPELDPRAVAVLPFENLSGTDEAEPLAAGLHDDLLTALSKVSGLTVISRTSVRGYRGTDQHLPQIARELGVGTIVEGGVQSAGGRIRLNVQLIEARRDVHRWAETYDRELSAENIFEIQSELAERIVECLQAELTGAVRERIEGSATADLDAYRLYAQGRIQLDRRTEAGLHRAVDFFQRAVERDSGYAPAWAGLAQALLLFGFYDYELPGDAPDAERVAWRAVELDPGLGEAYTAVGVLHSLRHEGPEALRTLERAVELGPSDADAHVWLGWIYLVLGQPANALEPVQRGAQLNPQGPAVRLYLAEVWLANGEPRNALREARRAREIQPEYGLAHFMEGLVLYHLERPAEARSALDQALKLVLPRGTPTRAEVEAILALVHAADGDRDAAREQLARIQQRAPEVEDRFPIGLIHAALGGTDRAFTAFSRVGRWDSPATELIRYYLPDVLGPLRQDPRYEELIRQVDESWGLERSAR